MNNHIYTIDLVRCTGCKTCSIACKDRANLPDDVDWLRVELNESGTYPSPTLYYRVMHCFHCSQPVCADVCPVSAINKLANGFVHIDADLCNGCEACIEGCPFSAITMLPAGIASKCDGCSDEINRDWDPTCVRACPMRALNFVPAEDIQLINRTRDQVFDTHGIGPGVVFLRQSNE